MMNLFSPYAKAYIALLGTIATALLGVFTADTTVGKVLTVIAVIATAYGTFRVPNVEVVKANPDEDEDEDEDDEPVVVTGSTPEEVETALDQIDDSPGGEQAQPDPEVSGNPRWGDHLNRPINHPEDV